MNLTSFIPQQFHTALTRLGKKAWANVEKLHGSDLRLTRSRPNIGRARDELRPDDKLALDFLMDHFDEEHPGRIYLLSKLFASGPKIFEPTVAQCEALARVEINLTLAEYRQPFEVLIVTLPADHATHHGAPGTIAIYHDPAVGWMTLLAARDPVRGHMYNTLAADGVNIETQLSGHQGDRKLSCGDLLALNHSSRIALNCALILTQYKIRLRRPCPERLRRLRGRCKHPDSTVRAQARQGIATEPYIIEFDHDVQFHEEETSLGAASREGTVARHPVTPHWRRGHWRRQAVGANWEQHRLLFIRPVLVRRDRFAGDLAHTRVTYYSRSNNLNVQ